VTAKSKRGLTYDPKKYARLLSTVQPRRIQTEEENEHFLEVIEKLIQKERTMEESMLLDLLISIVEDFEDEFYKMSDVSALDLLKSLMDDHSMSRKDLAQLIGSESRATEILSGTRTITKAQARILGEHFNLDPHAFIEV
jgi:HTH-type transcriptional regulator / antitoxin HigA